MKHIIPLIQATLACAIMVVLVFSIPTLIMAMPVRVDVSVPSWKQLLTSRQHPNARLSAYGSGN